MNGENGTVSGRFEEMASDEVLQNGGGARVGAMNDNFRAIRQRYLKENVPEISQASSKGSADVDAAARTFKRMLENVKKLEASADQLKQRICQLDCQFGEAIMRGAYLFDPATIEIMNGECPPGCTGELDPTKAYFKRQDVDEDYQSLVERLDQRPPPPGVNFQGEQM